MYVYIYICVRASYAGTHLPETAFDTAPHPGSEQAGRDRSGDRGVGEAAPDPLGHAQGPLSVSYCRGLVITLTNIRVPYSCCS